MFVSNGSVDIRLKVHEKDYDEVVDILDRAFIFYDRGNEIKKPNGVLDIYVASGVDTGHFEEYVVERLYKDLVNVSSVEIVYFKAEIIENEEEVKHYLAKEGKVVQIEDSEFITGVDTF